MAGYVTHSEWRNGGPGTQFYYYYYYYYSCVWLDYDTDRCIECSTTLTLTRAPCADYSVTIEVAADRILPPVYAPSSILGPFRPRVTHQARRTFTSAEQLRGFFAEQLLCDEGPGAMGAPRPAYRALLNGLVKHGAPELCALGL